MRVATFVMSVPDQDVMELTVGPAPFDTNRYINGGGVTGVILALAMCDAAIKKLANSTPIDTKQAFRNLILPHGAKVSIDDEISSATSDDPDTLERKRSRALWGNGNTGLVSDVMCNLELRKLPICPVSSYSRVSGRNRK